LPDDVAENFAYSWDVSSGNRPQGTELDDTVRHHPESDIRGPQDADRVDDPHRLAPALPRQLDRTHDRWEWRRKIRADPRKFHFYRIGVAIAGSLLIILGSITGPLPGPGGIPLMLLGLAVWASEFVWAHRLMQWFKQQLHKARHWSRRRQVLAWVIFFLTIGAIAYGYLAIIGVPGWLPHFAATWLRQLPGV
jgi:uncharacterized protein (TIGR02611 family)